MPDLLERNFCDGLEMKFTSPFGEIKQAGASETAAKSVTPCFYLSLDTSWYFIITYFHTELKSQVKLRHDEFSSIYTVHNVCQVRSKAEVR